MNKHYKIFLMGPQGSGKGTQGERLSMDFGIPTFSMGQLLRDELTTGSAFGRKFQEILRHGDLVSDTDAALLLKKRLEDPDTQQGYILDGYPRNLAQMRQFNFDVPTHVIVIEIPKEESIKRLGGRLTCRRCNHVASIHDGLKPGELCACGGEWYVREDDTPDAVARRLDIYEHDTQPVIAQYERQGIVHRIDGVGTIAEVHRRILDVLS